MSMKSILVLLVGLRFKGSLPVSSEVSRTLSPLLIVLVLSTQAMLGTLMNISSEASDQVSTGWLSQGTAAATINWILKDGLGQTGGIALITLLGSRLDSQARFLRFHATILFLIGSMLEFSIPIACNAFDYSNSSVFLILASAANVLKNVSWMVNSATRAHFMKNFALRGNLGDLTGKAASQMTLASLIGTGLGLLAIKGESFGNSFWIPAVWCLSAVIGVLATHRSCKSAISRQLNPQRIFRIIETLQRSRPTTDTIVSKHLARYVWTPEIVAEREKFIWPQLKTKAMHLNEPLNILSQGHFDWIVPVDQLESKKFCLAKHDTSFYLWTLESATNSDKLNGVILATLNQNNLEAAPEIVIEALSKQGWDVEHFSCKELDDKLGWLQLQQNKED